MVLAVFVGIGFCVIGIFLFLKPDVYWKLTEKWKSYRADGPSDFYILNTKFGGVVCAAGNRDDASSVDSGVKFRSD